MGKKALFRGDHSCSGKKAVNDRESLQQKWRAEDRDDANHSPQPRECPAVDAMMRKLLSEMLE